MNWSPYREAENLGFFTGELDVGEFIQHDRWESIKTSWMPRSPYREAGCQRVHIDELVIRKST